MTPLFVLLTAVPPRPSERFWLDTSAEVRRESDDVTDLIPEAGPVQLNTEDWGDGGTLQLGPSLVDRIRKNGDSG